MKINDFLTEQYFDHYEFNVTHQICNSDCEALTIADLLKLSNTSPEALLALDLGYTQATGSQELRELIAEQYSGIIADDVVVLGSPVEGIFLVANSLLQAGDEVIVLTPAYDALLNAFEYVVGAENVKRWQLSKRDKAWHLDLDELQSLVTPKTKMVVVNFPHNPTGYLPTTSFQNELCQLVEKSNATLFCDEMYFGLVHPPAKEIQPTNEILPNAISLSGLSKTFSLPGLRSGWLIVADTQKREQIINWKHYTSLCTAAPSQYLATLAMPVLDEIKNRNLAIINENLDIADGFFERHLQLFEWYRPLAGSTAIVKCHVSSVSKLAHQLATEADILILPTLGFGMDDQHFRLGLGRKNFDAGIQHLEQWLRQNPIS